jgi:protein-L-isoaspartate(D-aspartate) O-methyltransferase
MRRARAGPSDERARLIEELSVGVRDRRVLAAIAAVPRDVFVPEDLRRHAWSNTSLPIGEGQTISQPYVVARMCELLELRGHETVLDIGTGSGYHAAVLAWLAARVISIERFESLSEQARAALAEAGVDNVELICGDGSLGHPEAAPYEAINVAAASGHGVPSALADQLADGGRMVIPSNGRAQRLLVVRRHGRMLEQVPHDPVRFVPLICDAD